MKYVFSFHFRYRNSARLSAWVALWVSTFHRPMVPCGFLETYSSAVTTPNSTWAMTALGSPLQNRISVKLRYLNFFTFDYSAMKLWDLYVYCYLLYCRMNEFYAIKKTVIVRDKRIMYAWNKDFTSLVKNGFILNNLILI